MFREAFPILYTDDIERALRFYCEALGFSVGYRWPTNGALEYVYLRLDPLGIGIARRDVIEAMQRRPMAKQGAPQFELCLSAGDVDQAAAHLLAHGARQVIPPSDRPWGERLCYFEDPDGNLIQITAPLGRRLRAGCSLLRKTTSPA